MERFCFLLCFLKCHRYSLSIIETSISIRSTLSTWISGYPMVPMRWRSNRLAYGQKCSIASCSGTGIGRPWSRTFLILGRRKECLSYPYPFSLIQGTTFLSSNFLSIIRISNSPKKGLSKPTQDRPKDWVFKGWRKSKSNLGKTVSPSRI